MNRISESWESARRALLESDANNLSDLTGNTLEDVKESQEEAYAPTTHGADRGKRYPLTAREIFWALHKTYGPVQSDESLRDDLYRWLHQVQSVAWHVGVNTGIKWASGEAEKPLTNPYRTEES